MPNESNITNGQATDYAKFPPRVQYFDSQFLNRDDFIAEQDYHRTRQELHHQLHHTPGIADGLQVEAIAGGTGLEVSPGCAVDRLGRLIILSEKAQPDGSVADLVKGPSAPVEAAVVIVHGEQSGIQATKGVEKDTRWLPKPKLRIVKKTEAAEEPNGVVIANVQTDANGSIVQVARGRQISARLREDDEITIRRLRVSFSGSDATQWPMLSSNANRRLDVTGSLMVTEYTTLKGGLAVGDVARGGLLIANAGIDVNGGLAVSGRATLSGGLTVGGIGLRVTQNGLVVEKGGFRIEKDGAAVEGRTTLSGELIVSGQTTLSGGLSAKGPSVFNEELSVRGDATLLSSLTVSGATKLNSRLSLNDGSITLGKVDNDKGQGIYWDKDYPDQYGIFRTKGSWTRPDYAQLKIRWDTGIVLETISSYGKSYVEIAGGKGLRVTSGNVGIGTNDPTAKLHVVGSASVSGATTLLNTLTVSGATTLSGKLTAHAGLSVTSGLTEIGGSGLLVTQNGLVVQKGGLRIENDGAQVEGHTSLGGGLTVTGEPYISLRDGQIKLGSRFDDKLQGIYWDEQYPREYGIYRTPGTFNAEGTRTQPLTISWTTGIVLETQQRWGGYVEIKGGQDLRIGSVSVPSAGIIKLAHRYEQSYRAWQFGTGIQHQGLGIDDLGFIDVTSTVDRVVFVLRSDGNVVVKSDLYVEGDLYVRGKKRFT